MLAGHIRPLRRSFTTFGLLIPHTNDSASCVNVACLLALNALHALDVGMSVSVENAHAIGQVAIRLDGGQPGVNGTNGVPL